jgi:hypothetical protein
VWENSVVCTADDFGYCSIVVSRAGLAECVVGEVLPRDRPLYPDMSNHSPAIAGRHRRRSLPRYAFIYEPSPTLNGQLSLTAKCTEEDSMFYHLTSTEPVRCYDATLNQINFISYILILWCLYLNRT